MKEVKVKFIKELRLPCFPIFKIGKNAKIIVEHYNKDTIIVNARKPKDYKHPPYWDEVIAKKGTFRSCYIKVGKFRIPTNNIELKEYFKKL